MKLIRIDFNPSTNKSLHPSKILGWNYLSIPNLHGASVQVWEWISNFIPHFTCDYLSTLGLISNLISNRCIDITGYRLAKRCRLIKHHLHSHPIGIQSAPSVVGIRQQVYALKTESCHDANWRRQWLSGAASDDKVGSIKTFGFQCRRDFVPKLF